MRVSRFLQIGSIALAMASCAEAKDKPRPSLLPEVAKMAPVLTCIDAASSKDQAALTGCLEEARIPLEKVGPDAVSLNDFKQRVVLAWLYLGRDAKYPLNPDTLPNAIDYAKCVEGAAYADPAFSSGTGKGVAEATFRSEQACKDHRLSFRKLDPNSKNLPSNVAERLFAQALANTALTFALEQNKWFPDEMRECVRYADGRPPSVGCKGKRGVPPFAPPPPVQMPTP